MLDLQRIPPPRFPDVRLRTPANWTAVIFLASLGAVHLAIAIPAALHNRWEGSLSFFFAFVFLLAARIVRHWSVEIALLPSRRQIRVRTGTTRWHAEKVIPFEAVSSIRLTFHEPVQPRASIEIVCQNETLECPSTPVPRQEALFFSMMLEVPLVKISDGEMRESADADANASLPINQEGTKDQRMPF